MKRREAIRSIVGGLTVLGGAVSAEVAVVEGSDGLRSNSVLVVQDAVIHLKQDLTLRSHMQFLGCKFTGNGSIIVPEEFNTPSTVFNKCRFDNSDRESKRAWIIGPNFEIGARICAVKTSA